MILQYSKIIASKEKFTSCYYILDESAIRTLSEGNVLRFLLVGKMIAF